MTLKTAITRYKSALPALLRSALPGALAAALAFGSATAYAGYNVWTGDYTFSRQELQSGIKSRFPRNLRYLEMFDVRLSNPELALDPAKNRIVTKINARVTSQLFFAAPLNGVLTINSGLKYDAAARTVRLDQPVVERVDMDGMPASYAQQMNDIGNVVAAQVLADYPLYTFKPEELQLNGQRFEPGAITVTADGIKVEIRQL